MLKLAKGYGILAVKLISIVSSPSLLQEIKAKI